MFPCPGIALTLALAAAPAPPPLFLVASSDHHGAYETEADGGAARLGGYRQRVARGAFRAGGRFLHVHAGDLFQGSAAVNRSRGRAVLPLMEVLRFHLGVPGNHEWDYGPEAFHSLAKLRRPRLVATNIVGLGPSVPPTAWYQLGAARLAFLGYTIPDTARRAPPGATTGLRFRAGERLAAAAARARRRGATALVLLTHTDRDEAESLGRRVGADLVVGGHTNEVIPPKRLGSAGPWYVQAGHRFRHAARLRLDFDDAGRLVQLRGRVDPLDDWTAPADPAVEEALRPFLEEVARDMARGVAVLDRPILKGRWSGHSPLVAAGAHAIREASGADLAVLNPKSFRVGRLGPGPVTQGDLYEATPYENRVAIRTMTTTELDAAFETLVSAEFRPFEDAPGSYLFDPRGILQPSGFTVRIDPKAAPGARVRLLDPAGAPLPAQRSYRVATTDYIAAGGDEYHHLAGEHEVLDVFVRGALANRLRHRGADADAGPGKLDNLTQSGG